MEATPVGNPPPGRQGSDAVFRRRRPVDDDPDPVDFDDDTADLDDEVAAEEDDPATEAAEEPAAPVSVSNPQGPWDAADAPADELLDLGGLRVPVVEGFDISITAEEEVPVVVTYSADDGLMQLHAFAAPRSSGIWDEVRDEIAQSLKESGGSASDADGTFGVELRATIPVQQPDGSTALQPARFVGVDGPRWFLRALLTGPMIERPARSAELEAIIRRVVVVRGPDAMAPRDVIPLKLPREVVAAAEAAAADGEDGPPRMPERGPEITEVR